MTTTINTITATPIETYLNRHGEEAWAATLTTLLRSVHEVDKNATQIWFSFYPLSLFRALQAADNPERLAAQLLMQGVYQLKDQIDSSHRFLYGHRYWPSVKKAVGARATSLDTMPDASLVNRILEVAREVAEDLKVETPVTLGISAIAFMTLRQVGIEAFNAAPGSVLIDPKFAKKSPEQIL